MPNPKTKLPPLVIVLNIIMIVLIIVICGLVFSLTYSDAVRGEQTTTSATTTAFDVEIGESKEASAEAESTTAATTTKATTSVSMTKRTTEPTEPVEDPVESTTAPVEDEPAPVINTAYDKSFFENDLFIGDSISTGLYLYNKVGMKNVAATVGFTPYKAYNDDIDLPDGTTGTALSYAKKMQPTRIFIMLGSNGLASASAMEGSYETLIDKLSSVCPDSAIYCISVSPVTVDSTGAANGGITNDMVTSFNAFIKAMCTDKGIRYLDFYSEIIDENGYFIEEYAEADGLHFKGITYDRMLNFLQNSVS